MKYLKITPILFACLLLAACSSDQDDLASNPVEAPLEQQAIELGTDIKDVIEPKAASKKAPEEAPEKKDSTLAKSDAQELRWDDLVPDDFKPEAITQKYQQEITDAAEGSLEERILFKKIMAELNNAGPNTKLDGKKVRIPGFVSPLDTNGELVGDFLLVPYFGSCIHSPPPPVNQTVMVSPGQGKSIALSQISRPVWVVGELEADQVTTDLATAGYQIKNARIEPYVQPVN